MFLPFLPKDVRKRTPEGPQSGPRIHQNLTFFRPLLGTRNTKSQILLAPRDGVTPFFHKIETICPKNAINKFIEKNTLKKMVTDVKMESRRLPKWSQKLRNSGPEPDLEKPSDKNPQNIDSVHYLLCFKHIQGLPKT